MRQLSQYAQKRVEAVGQNKETGEYIVLLRDGYVFKGRYIQGEIRGYSQISCWTVAEIKESCKKIYIQEGVGFVKGQEDLEQEYSRILKEESKELVKTLERVTEKLQSQGFQKELKETLDKALEKSKEKMASPEWQQEIQEQAWRNIFKEIGACIQYCGKEETYNRYFRAAEDAEFKEKSHQAQKILEVQKSKRNVDWIIPYTLNKKEGFLVQMKKGLKNPVFIQNADELRAALENLALC